ncbi:hypothetical protein X777_00504 [Ooceraea biroi]|uniref:Uncharacterized protein n=1 Tax=Ooceraea biroi TaxID=2015173 RepID=A0A026WTP4_OOCBI|nr:hypothetical protein X777_00504 [Ooceraea biroi]
MECDETTTNNVDLCNSQLLTSLHEEASGTVKMTKKRAAQGNKSSYNKGDKQLPPNKRLDRSRSPVKNKAQEKTTNEPSNSEPKDSVRYIKTDSGPFKAIISCQPTDKDNASNFPPLDVEVTRSLVRMGVKFELIERLERKIVIKGIPTDVPNEELWEELKNNNHEYVFNKEDIFA